MRRNWVALVLILVVLSVGFSSASATPPASEYGKLALFLFFLNFLYIVLEMPCFKSLCHLLHFCLFIIYVSAEIISGVVSNVVSGLVKWLWSLKTTTKTGIDFSLTFRLLSRCWSCLSGNGMLSDILMLKKFMGSIFSSSFWPFNDEI